MTINCKLTREQIESILVALEHVRNQATTSGNSGYGIDKLCRKEASTRWWTIISLLRTYIGEDKKK